MDKIRWTYCVGIEEVLQSQEGEEYTIYDKKEEG